MLRSYQRDLVRDVLRRVNDRASILMVAPTGAGKTRMAVEVVRACLPRGPVLWVVPRVEVHAQTVATLRGASLPVVELTAGQTLQWPARGVLCAMAQTLVRRLAAAHTPRLSCIVIDEAHYSPDVAAAVRSRWPGVAMVGLTATPTREDAQLAEVYNGGIVSGPSYRSLSAMRYLVPWRVLTPTQADLSPLRPGWREQDAAPQFRGLVGDVAATWARHARGRRTLTFAAGREHGQELVRAYQRAGASVAYADSSTPDAERAALLAQLRTGRLRVLVNVALWIEGLDVPEVDCVTLATATDSLAKYLQACGRASRPAPGKTTALLIDHGGNVSRHGLPDDDRDWLLPSTRVAGSSTIAHHSAPDSLRRPPRTRPGELQEVPASAAQTAPSIRPCPAQWMPLRDLWLRLETERLQRHSTTALVDSLMAHHARRLRLS